MMEDSDVRMTAPVIDTNMAMLRYRLLIALLVPALLPAQERVAPRPLVLSLKQAIRMSLAPEGDIGVRVAEESLRIAEARFKQSRTALWPAVEGSVSGQNQKLSLAALGLRSIRLPVAEFAFPDSVGPFNTFDARVRVRQSVLDLASGS